jgi:uncharacterized protein (DUF934 family)
MATLIRNRRLERDSWRLLDDPAPWLAVGEDGFVPDFPAEGGLIVPLALWPLRREDLLDRRSPVGVRLAAHEGPEEIADDLGHLALVAVHFPKFSDGRGLSIARLLRERYGYEGEVRAVGDVLRDQLPFLERCGFDAFALRDDRDPAAALAAFAELSDAYQGTVAEPRPLFRRRLAAAAASRQ